MDRHATCLGQKVVVLNCGVWNLLELWVKEQKEPSPRENITRRLVSFCQFS